VVMSESPSRFDRSHRGVTSDAGSANVMAYCAREENMTASEWPKQGPASYFPSIEQKYGKTIKEWQTIIRECGKEKHMAIVSHLKSEHQMGHGHANALVGWTLRGHQAK